MRSSLSPVQPRRWRPRNIVLGQDGLVRPLWRALAFAALLVPLAGVLQLALRAVPPTLSANTRVALGSSLLAAAALLVSWALQAALDRQSFRALGLWFHPAWRQELFIGVGIGSGLMGVVVGLQLVFGGVRYAGVGSELPSALLEAGSLVPYFVAWAALEEILYRGYAFQRFVDSFGRVGAIAIFSLPFALGHWGTPGATWISTVNTVLQAALFAVAYLKTRALWLPIGLHFAWNYTMMVVLSLHLSNIRIQFGAPLLRAELRGPDWLSGGSYGPEGSLVLTMATAVLLLWMVRTRLLVPSERVVVGMRHLRVES